MRIVLFIFAALFAAGGAGFYLFQTLSAPVEQAVVAAPPPKTTRSVYVPKYDLPAGTLISLEMLTELELEIGAVSEQMIVPDGDGDENLIGAVARQALADGVPIARSALVQPGERGFLAAVLPKGKRAISFEISEVAGMIGLIQPGDRVDMILTYTVTSDDDSLRDVHASETVMTNLRVLALDQRLQSNTSYIDEDGQPIQRPVARVATLEVTPVQAERVTLAASLGNLSLVLNSIQDGGEPDVAGLDDSFDSLVEPMLRQGPDNGATVDAKSVRVSPNARTGGLGITIDTDVTSLLPRSEATKVQVVRGGGQSSGGGSDK